MSEVVVTSTTDTPEQVLAAQGLGAKPSEQAKEESKAAPAEEIQTDETLEASEPQDDAETEEVEAKEQDDEGEKERPKKKGGFKRRIDKLNTKLSQAEQEREFWRQEALRVREGKALEDKPVEKPAIKVDGRPTAEQFESHEEYVEALADWKVEQKLSQRELKQKEVETKTAFERQVQAHQERVSQFAKEHEDFHDVMEDVDDVAMSLTVQEVILGSEHGPALMYELAKSPEEFKRICNLPAIACARELGKIEARLSKNSDDSQPEIKTTKAPRPISPVKTKVTATVSLDEMDYQAFKKAREAQLR